MISRLTLLLLAIFFSSIAGFAQPFFFRYDSVPVTENGTTLLNPWAGGCNSCQFSEIDVNMDGIKDLFVFDRTGNKISIFLNDGSLGGNNYKHASEYAFLFPRTLENWVLLRDFNCDGKEDIFTATTGGMAVYKNISTTSTGLQFDVEKPLVFSLQQGNFVNLFVTPVDIPAIDDLDGDGDLDILTFGVVGSFVEYHRNLSVENGFGCDSLDFELRNKCWGYFSENVVSNSVTISDSCLFNVPDSELTADEDARTVSRHAGSTLVTIDMNGDGDKELILGDVSFNNMVMLENGGDSANALAINQDTAFPSNSVPVDMPIFPAGFHLDLDNDGKRDFIASPNSPNLSLNEKSSWFYKNQGTDESPIFEFASEEFLQDGMIEMGEGAYPAFLDHNNDGLMDLIVGNFGFFEPGGTFSSRLTLYENVGTISEPAFNFVTDDYQNLSTMGLGNALYPTFGDLDGDGDMDMMLGEISGVLHYFENTAATGATATFTASQLNFQASDGNAIDVGQFSTPQLYDLNGDDVLDLIIGERNGNVNYYENTGTSTAPSFELTKDSLGNFDVAEWWDITGFSVPVAFRDSIGTKLLVGSKQGSLHLFDNIDGNLTGDFNLVDSTYESIFDGIRSAPALTDLDNDGTLDMIMGNYRGGLAYFGGSPTVGIQDNADLPTWSFNLYPNPTANQLNLKINRLEQAKTSFQVINLLGEVVLEADLGFDDRTNLDVSNYPNGLYFLKVVRDGAVQSKSFVVAH